MILTKEVEVKINSSNFKYFKKYNPKKGDIINVKINELNIGSSAIITVQCDECGKIKNMKYKNYKSYGYDNSYYLCRSCKMIKNNNDKYGVDNVFQINNIKEKRDMFEKIWCR